MFFKPTGTAHHALLNAAGWKPRPSVGSTFANYTHPKTQGAITLHSNGSWEHNNLGKTLQEGSSHIDLKRYLGMSQHAETNSVTLHIQLEDQTEQFKEPIHLGNGWYFHKVAMDANGNHRVHVSKGANRGFSIQTNGVLPKTHRIGRGGTLDDGAKAELFNHLEKTRGISQHAEEDSQQFSEEHHKALIAYGFTHHPSADPAAFHYTRAGGGGTTHSVVVHPSGSWAHTLFGSSDKKAKLSNGVGHTSLIKHLSQYGGHLPSQHSEETEQKILSTHLHPAMAVFAPPIETKKAKKEEPEQFAEKRFAYGRSNFLAGRRFSDRLRRIVKAHGGEVQHNGAFSVPKHAAEAFHEAAGGAGFKNGYHYSLG